MDRNRVEKRIIMATVQEVTARNADQKRLEDGVDTKPIPIILLNGPPKSGKDAIAGGIRCIRPYEHMKFAAPLKEALAILMGESVRELEEMKDVKWQPMDSACATISRRDLLIRISEDLIKPAFHRGHWGSLLARQVVQMMKTDTTLKGFVFSDLGFIDEYETFIEELAVLMPGVKFNIIIVQIHRGGTNFDNDSRGYVTPLALPEHKRPEDVICTAAIIKNDSTVHEAVRQIIDLVSI